MSEYRISNTDWMADAVCREHPAATFFPQDGVGVVKAQRICATCPVASECLEYALVNHVDHGVWGGKSERERRRLQRAIRRGSFSIVTGNNVAIDSVSE
jgi:WhiB family redox-sensing transcriptional regulator